MTIRGGTTVLQGTLQGDSNSLQGDITNNATLVFNQAGNGTYSGVVSGSGDFFKTGAGELALSQDQTYTGQTNVQAGILTLNGFLASPTISIDGGELRLGASDLLSSTSSIAMTSGTFNLNGFNQTIGSLSGASGTVDLGSGQLTINNTTDQSFGGVITGSGSLVKDGSSTLTLTNTNDYTGQTAVQNGVLQIDGLFGSQSIAVTGGELKMGAADRFTSSVDVNVSSGTFNLNNFDQTIGSLSGSGGTVDLGSSQLTVNGSTDGTFGGMITGSGFLFKDGSSLLTLTGDNNYTGATTVQGGVLQVDGLLASPAITISGGEFRMGAVDRLSHTADVSLTAGTFNLNNFDQTIGTLSGTGGTLALGTGI